MSSCPLSAEDQRALIFNHRLTYLSSKCVNETETISLPAALLSFRCCRSMAKECCEVTSKSVSGINGCCSIFSSTDVNWWRSGLLLAPRSFFFSKNFLHVVCSSSWRRNITVCGGRISFLVQFWWLDVTVRVKALSCFFFTHSQFIDQPPHHRLGAAFC